VRLGVIGTGLAIEKLHWPALRQLTDRFGVVAFANHTRPKAEAFARTAGLDMQHYYADYADLLRRDDVEGVLIALPIPLLYPASRDALAAGKHVICEKPAGADLEQARAFLKLPEQYPDRKLLLAENFFYRDDLRLARRLLDDGAIGRVHMLQWRVVLQGVPKEGEYTNTGWRIEPEYRGGFFLDAGVHHTAQMRMLCGEVDQLQAYALDANPTMGGPSDMVLNLRFATSAIGNYTGAYLPIATPEESGEMRLYGSDGILSLVGGTRSLQVFRADGNSETRTIPNDGGYVNQLINFFEAIRFDEPIVGTVAQSYHNLAIIMRALDSAESGQPVTMHASTDDPRPDGVPLWHPRGADPVLESS
jgi:predicted dehydrogenase